MYVCCCVGVTDRTIRESIREGAVTLEDVVACTGAGSSCGACRAEIACMVREHAPPQDDGRRHLAISPRGPEAPTPSVRASAPEPEPSSIRAAAAASSDRAA
jgi:bacterioferritin-associated ferredoxin